jgi:hypothetical protein
MSKPQLTYKVQAAPYGPVPYRDLRLSYWYPVRETLESFIASDLPPPCTKLQIFNPKKDIFWVAQTLLGWAKLKPNLDYITRKTENLWNRTPQIQPQPRLQCLH